MLRWVTVSLVTFFCLVGAGGLRIYLERQVPQNVKFDVLLEWAERPARDAAGLVPTSSVFVAGHLKYGFDLRVEQSVKAETRRRLLLLESRAKTPDETTQWLGTLLDVSSLEQINDLKNRPGEHQDYFFLSFLMLDCQALLSEGKDQQVKPTIRDGLAKLFQSKSLDISKDKRALNCVRYYFSTCQSQGELAQAYEELLSLAPYDPAWIDLLGAYVVGAVKRDLYRHRLVPTILQNLRQNRHSRRAKP